MSDFLVKLKEDNNFKVKKFEEDSADDIKFISIRGNEVLGNYVSHRILIVGPSNAGKTTLVLAILDKILSIKTKIYWFSETALKDTKIIEFFDEHKSSIEYYKSTKIDGESLLPIIMDEYDEKPLIYRNEIIPKAIIIFDDIADELKDKNVRLLFKTIRHIQSMLICVIHDLTDSSKSIRQELTMLYLFAGISEERFLMLLNNVGFISPEFSSQEIYSLYEKMVSFNKRNYIKLNKMSHTVHIYKDGEKLATRS